MRNSGTFWLTILSFVDGLIPPNPVISPFPISPRTPLVSFDPVITRLSPIVPLRSTMPVFNPFQLPPPVNYLQDYFQRRFQDRLPNRPPNNIYIVRPPQPGENPKEEWKLCPNPALKTLIKEAIYSNWHQTYGACYSSRKVAVETKANAGRAFGGKWAVVVIKDPLSSTCSYSFDHGGDVELSDVKRAEKGLKADYCMLDFSNCHIFVRKIADTKKKTTKKGAKKGTRKGGKRRVGGNRKKQNTKRKPKKRVAASRRASMSRRKKKKRKSTIGQKSKRRLAGKRKSKTLPKQSQKKWPAYRKDKNRPVWPPVNRTRKRERRQRRRQRRQRFVQ